MSLRYRVISSICIPAQDTVKEIKAQGWFLAALVSCGSRGCACVRGRRELDVQTPIYGEQKIRPQPVSFSLVILQLNSLQGRRQRPGHTVQRCSQYRIIDVCGVWARCNISSSHFATPAQNCGKRLRLTDFSLLRHDSERSVAESGHTVQLLVAILRRTRNSSLQHTFARNKGKRATILEVQDTLC